MLLIHVPIFLGFPPEVQLIIFSFILLKGFLELWCDYILLWSILFIFILIMFLWNGESQVCGCYFLLPWRPWGSERQLGVQDLAMCMWRSQVLQPGLLALYWALSPRGPCVVWKQVPLSLCTQYLGTLSMDMVRSAWSRQGSHTNESIQ